jgi:glycine cleavage system H protein
MVTLLFVSLVVLFVLLDVLVVRRLEKRPPEPLPGPDTKKLPAKDEIAMPPDYHFHPGHTWALSKDGAVAVGVDDLIQATTGRLTAVTLPSSGDAVAAGQQVIGLAVGGREIKLVAPVDGTVDKVNGALAKRPTLVNDDPYGKGWLFTIRPGGAESQLQGLPVGDPAVEWMKAEMAKMDEFVTQYRKGTSPGSMLVGGNHEVWNMFQDAFLSGAREEA